MKLVLLSLLMILSAQAGAQTFPGMISVKERLRILLWTEGLGKQALHTKYHRNRTHLPEEIERPLRKL